MQEAYFAEALAHNEEDIERSMSGKGKGGCAVVVVMVVVR